MKKTIWLLALALVAAGCGAQSESLSIPIGSDVRLERTDGEIVTGRLLEVRSDAVVVEEIDGRRTFVRRTDIASIRMDSTSAAAAAPVVEDGGAPVERRARRAASAEMRPARRLPEYREVTVPAGTVLRVELEDHVASDSSSVEDRVEARLHRAVTTDGMVALPAGSRVVGEVTHAKRSGRVKGRAEIAFRFHMLTPAGSDEPVSISTERVFRRARATKAKDAKKIGIPAAAGAAIGGILGGGSGAAKGAAIGGGAGTGMVLATRGEEVRFGPGARFAVKLLQPITVRVPLGE